MSVTTNRFELYRVETPEGITITYTPAGLASRSLAAMFDYTVMLVLFVTGLVTIMVSGSVADEDVVGALLALLAFAINWGYYVIFELVWNGQTPGKRLLRLRVIREGGRPVDGAAVVVRNLMRAIDFLPFGYGVGMLTVFVDRYHRRLGDLTAGTVVVREGQLITLSEMIQPMHAHVSPRAPDAPPTPLLPNVERLTSADVALVVEFLQCRDALFGDARVSLAHQFAAVIRQRLSLPPSDSHPEQFLEHVVREYEVAQAMMARQSG
ncbi:MAG: transporter [Chloroflexus sp.]|uniref:RDD family protein n=1 Tax=Chloroflexus sp. TaxID=1904827 RepID=UPI0021DE947A|nr:RDD family protein [Chloroflexus sp.]GIV89927.1 MAG: transporter [Chloroflexus sp.]